MNKKVISLRKLSKQRLRILKSKRIEIERAMKALSALKNTTNIEQLVHTHIHDNGVFVEVLQPNSVIFSQNISNLTTDRSIEDTLRAIRTLNSAPTKEVGDFYAKLANINNIRAAN